MLSTEGRAPRARRSCYVNEPAYGFFIAGSSIKQMNGIYIRRAPPGNSEEDGEEEGDSQRKMMLYYKHMDSSWEMALAESQEDQGPRFGRDDDSEWLLIDERGNDRFKHKGNTIVPGAGVSWRHLHRSSAQGRRGAESSSPRRGWFGSSALADANSDNEDELPWQVIAVLDYDILRQLVGGAEYHKRRVDDAVAGRGVVDPPALTSLEGCYLPGQWIYQVVAKEGEPPG